MKKYLIVSIATISLSLYIVIHLYRTKEIPWIDELVETSAKVLGVSPTMVKEKVMRRRHRELNIAESMTPVAQQVDPDSTLLQQEDSALVLLPDPLPEDQMISKKAPPSSPVTPVPDSPKTDTNAIKVAVTPPPSPPPIEIKPKKKFFNSESAAVKTTSTGPIKTGAVLFFSGQWYMALKSSPITRTYCSERPKHSS